MSFVDTSQWIYTNLLESYYFDIKNEFDKFDKSLYIKNKEDKIEQVGSWFFVPFIAKGRKIDKFISYFPTVEKIINTVPVYDNCTFSIMSAGSKILPHCGHSNNHFRVHLAIDVNDQCYLQVGTQKRLWQNGKLLIFEDYQEHQAHNDSDYDRIVFLFDITKQSYYNNLQ